MRINLTEATDLAAAATPAEGPGRLLIQLINPGFGSSGYYSEAVLKQAAKDRIFPAGTHMYVNHQTAQERYERPEGDLRDLAAVLTEDARWDNTKKALVAEAKVYSQWRKPLADMAADIGVSIRGAAETSTGTVDGRTGTIIDRLIEGISVDFVTRAGRGGRVLQVLEAARAGITEAASTDRFSELSTLVKDEYGAEKTWPWVLDFDDASTTVWFQVESPDEVHLYAQPYEITDDVATALTGDRTEVRRKTVFVPVDTPTDQAVGEAQAAAAAQIAATGAALESALTTAVTPTQTPSAPVAEGSEAAPAAEPTPPAVEAGTTPPHMKEDPMGTIQVDEARHASLEEKAALVPALEAKVVAAEARADAAEAERDQAVAASKARDFARKLAAEANKDLVAPSLDAIVAEATRNPLPLDSERRLDTEKFAETVEAARKAHETFLAQIAEASGVGSVRGVGQVTTEPTDITESDLDAGLARISKGA